MIISMLFTMFLFLLTGYPVAFTISGVPLLFAFFGHIIGIFDLSYVSYATKIKNSRRIIRIYGYINE